MRTFVAIGADGLSFDPVISFKKAKVNLLIKEIEHRWVPVTNYHITLCFLGETGPEKLTSVMEELGTIAREHDPFELSIEGMGAFPDERAGRVVWVGVQNSISLRSLQSDCERIMRAQGFDIEERDYKPHLTVARLRSPRKLTDILSPLKKQSFGSLKVEHLTLFESKLAGSFPVYEPIGHFNLGKPI